jgi:hypothetical protein
MCSEDKTSCKKMVIYIVNLFQSSFWNYTACTGHGVSKFAFGLQVGTFYLQRTANLKTIFFCQARNYAYKLIMTSKYTNLRQ